ncbi:HupE/UreJ family protein [Alteromonas lipolytica]|uniref:Urease accessory protein UreJ n=1 Tax=Alteromonas lipolytica TaxID=1856405 RepID=A0A1E8FE05_9ALTE|nr:HupE/UreJ family protein [Alteromonas lipolytica]OFI34150.1 hypothetical protein BFC17_21645 [Alteromonas lipolytica]GGF64975.1 protein hupE [Alteromonas lipolytica]
MTRKIKLASGLLLSFATAAPALAHTGHDTVHNSLMAGLTHPLMGADHLIAMIAMGFWASTFAAKQSRSMLTAFFALLLGGFTLGLAGISFSFMETGIVLTSVMTGLLIATRKNVTQGLAVSLAACFAMFHGFAHGLETAGSVPFLFATGFLMTSATLVMAGFAVSKLVSHSIPSASRLIGLVIAMMGVSLFSI